MAQHRFGSRRNGFRALAYAGARFLRLPLVGQSRVEEVQHRGARFIPVDGRKGNAAMVVDGTWTYSAPTPLTVSRRSPVTRCLGRAILTRRLI
jgi:hypothetical protein